MKKKREYVPVAAEDRKSLKAWAKGAREEVLRPHIAAYTDALERGWRAERDYLDEVCREYHAIFDWQLKDHEEPPQPLVVYDKFALPVVEALEPEQAEEKRVRKEMLNSRILRWLKYRARALRKTVKMDPRNDPYAILLGKLSGINAPPKARQAFQQYMHESYDTEIAPAVQARWAATRDNLNGNGAAATQKGPNAPFRALVARELFAELTQEEQDALKERAKEEAATAREEYEKKRKAPPSKSPEDRQRCIDALGAFLSPILRGIQEYTGLHSVAIFGGPMPKYGGELKTVHVAYGRSRDAAPALFPQWAKARFNRDVVGLMHEYLQAAFTAVECAEAALPQSGDGPAPGGSKSHKDRTTGSSDDSDSDDDSDASTIDSDGSGSDGGSETEAEEEADVRKGKKAKGKEKAKEQAKGKAKKAKKAVEKKAKKAAQKEAQEREKAGAMGKGRARKGAPSGAGGDTAKKRKRRGGEGGESDGEGGPKKKRKAAAGSEKENAGEGEGAGASKKRKRGREDEGSAMESGESGDKNDSVRGADEEEYEAPAAPKSKKAATAPLRRSGRKAAKLSDNGDDTEKEKKAPAEANVENKKSAAVVGGADGSNGAAAGDGGVTTTAKKKKGGKAPERPNPTPKPRGERPTNPSTGDPLPLSSTAASLLGTTASTSAPGATSSADVVPPPRELPPQELPPQDMPPCPDAAPQWLQYTHEALCGVDVGPVFNEAVNAWLELQRVQGFKSMGSLPKAKRPDEITKWISGSRAPRDLPEDGATAAAFGARLVDWWRTLQPAWRVTTGSITTWVRSPMHAANEAPKTWAALRVAGANGPFTALLGVYWWGREEIKAGGKHSDDWIAMAQDFEWAMWGLWGAIREDDQTAAEAAKVKGKGKAKESGGTDMETDQLRSD
ncbi:hypothetical protein B0H16DRAFT_1477362 [Mycena metata]|uniref:Uncharacterized protein n=1 Tax=Mycena metata TaxID=1033252 RepID=A0AAD7H942_9AGAR|nr:hypothetical protein B0H16DRAFT_1477362 [Mycena metata]